MRDVVIASAVRTPTGKFLGALKDFTAPQLGALVVADAVRRAGIDPAVVDECIMGNVVSAGLGQNPARQAALRGGLPDHVAALTINKVCGSGLKAVMLAAQGVATGDIDIAVAGGMESMSRCPYLLPRVREGLRLGHAEVMDAMIHDGLWCAFENYHMGHAGEVVAERYHVGRDAQDAFAARSHEKALHAADSGWFADEILPISIPQKKGPPIVVNPRRVDPRRRHGGSAREARPGVQEGRDGDRRQRSGRERRRVGSCGDGRRTRAIARHRSPRTHPRPGHERSTAEARPDDAR